MAINNILLFVSCLLLSSCARGLLYTNTITPACTDMRGSTIGAATVSGGSYKIEVPTGRIDLTAEWDSRAIAEVAKRNGITKIHACDKKTFSILLGIFRKDEIIIYGEKL